MVFLLLLQVLMQLLKGRNYFFCFNAAVRSRRSQYAKRTFINNGGVRITHNFLYIKIAIINTFSIRLILLEGK